MFESDYSWQVLLGKPYKGDIRKVKNVEGVVKNISQFIACYRSLFHTLKHYQDEPKYQKAIGRLHFLLSELVDGCEELHIELVSSSGWDDSDL